MGAAVRDIVRVKIGGERADAIISDVRPDGMRVMMRAYAEADLRPELARVTARPCSSGASRMSGRRCRSQRISAR